MSSLMLPGLDALPTYSSTIAFLSLNPSSAAGDAVFSPCGTYRYVLRRDLTDPATAKDPANDQTIRKDIGFGQRWAFARLVKINLFARVNTDPRGLSKARDPVGPENDEWILREAKAADCVVCAWGTHTFLGSLLRDRAKAVMAMLRAERIEMSCMGRCADGSPKHPLMLPWTTQLEPWSGL